jgi:hypothetical protein
MRCGSSLLEKNITDRAHKLKRATRGCLIRLCNAKLCETLGVVV